MIVENVDVLRKIKDNIDGEIEYRLFSDKAEAGIAPTEFAPLHGYLEKGTLMAGLKENQEIKVDIRTLFAEIWNSFAYFEFEGKRVCERKAYGKPMLAIDETFFEQGGYSKFVEESMLASKGSREIIVDDLSGAMPASIMREFIKWKEEGGE